jgi:NADPH:quinone reductase-like Zn-dependent oxidoreductase
MRQLETNMPGPNPTEGPTMRAVGITRFGGPGELTPMTVPRPAPLPTEVLVRVHAAGVNPLDWRTRAGLPTPAAAALGAPPHILGWDVSGVVEETGAGEFLFAPGDEVFGLLWLPRPAGAYAEYVTAPSRQFARKPAAIGHDHAAGIPLAGLTAWHALTDIAGLQPGQRVLIHAAGGGVGHLAVQLARHLGAHVTATASSAKHDWLRDLGAAEVIDYRATPFEKVAHDIDVVLDLVGMAQPDTAPRSLQVLRPGGLFIGIAPRRSDGFADRAASAGVRVAPEPLVEPDGHGLAELARLIDNGELAVHLDRVFPLDQAAQAHAHAENGATGKTVLRIAD